jgi:hypothetical protein
LALTRKIPFSFNKTLAGVQSDYKISTNNCEFFLKNGTTEAFFCFIGNLRLIGSFSRLMRTFNEQQKTPTADANIHFTPSPDGFFKNSSDGFFKRSSGQFTGLDPSNTSASRYNGNFENHRKADSAQRDPINSYNRPFVQSNFVRTDLVPL